MQMLTLDDDERALMVELTTAAIIATSGKLRVLEAKKQPHAHATTTRDFNMLCCIHARMCEAPRDTDDAPVAYDRPEDDPNYNPLFDTRPRCVHGALISEDCEACEHPTWPAGEPPPPATPPAGVEP